MSSSEDSAVSADEDGEDLFENAPCGYLSLGKDGRIARVNATFCAWTGFSSAETLSKRFHQLLSIASRVYMETHVVPLLRMQRAVNEVALDLVMKNGERLPVLLNAVERLDEQGAHRFTRLTLFNATDRRRYERELLDARAAAEKAKEELKELNLSLEQQIADGVESRLKIEETLRQSQKMEAIGQLTGGIAHDFNNLLAGITGSMELLLIHIKKGRHDVLPRYAEAALGAARRAATLTHRLLTFSRHHALEPKAVDANQLVAGMEDLIRRSIGPAISLQVVGSGGLWATLIDPNQLENALLNLCINARDAMPKGGRLTIETGNKWFDDRLAVENDLPPGQYVAVSVTDTGTGMSPEVIARVFEPFFTTKPEGAGTGLGLSMVYGFARQAGGHVKIYSEVGLGTTIRLYLPRHRGELDVAVATAPTEPRPAGVEHSEIVLLVDDEPTVRMFITEVLHQAGYHSIEASEGSTALKILRSDTRIDLLITDIGLPGGLNGRQLAEEACLHRPGLKVLFITGYAENAALNESERSLHILNKPFTLDELSSKVTRLLQPSSLPRSLLEPRAR